MLLFNCSKWHMYYIRLVEVSSSFITKISLKCEVMDLKSIPSEDLPSTLRILLDVTFYTCALILRLSSEVAYLFICVFCILYYFIVNVLHYITLFVLIIIKYSDQSIICISMKNKFLSLSIWNSYMKTNKQKKVRGIWRICFFPSIFYLLWEILAGMLMST